MLCDSPVTAIYGGSRTVRSLYLTSVNAPLMCTFIQKLFILACNLYSSSLRVSRVQKKLRRQITRTLQNLMKYTLLNVMLQLTASIKRLYYATLIFIEQGSPFPCLSCCQKAERVQVIHAYGRPFCYYIASFCKQ